MMIHFADKRGVDVTISRSTLKCKNDQIDLESLLTPFGRVFQKGMVEPFILYTHPIQWRYILRGERRRGGESYVPLPKLQKEPQKASGQRMYRDSCPDLL